jgi:mRNA interferase RelE/StbE
LKILEEDPVPKGVLKMKGEEDVYRLRVGDYRVLYKILRDEACVLVFKVEHGKRVYRKSNS